MLTVTGSAGLTLYNLSDDLSSQILHSQSSLSTTKPNNLDGIIFVGTADLTLYIFSLTADKTRLYARAHPADLTGSQQLLSAWNVAASA